MAKVAVLILLTYSSMSCQITESASFCQTGQADVNSVDAIINRLKQTTSRLQSYQGQIHYLIKQPDFDSQTLRKGVMYYAKFGKGSKLMVNFTTLKQDDEKEQKYMERFIFDGVWLTHIDYQIKSVERHQLAEPNEPIDAFELANRNFPVIGFSKIEELRKQFEIELVESKEDEANNLTQLHLKVKPDSVYKDDYTSAEFWIDNKLGLPVKIVTVSAEGDIYELKLLKAIIDKKIDDSVFKFDIPKGFTIEEVPLEENSSS